MVKQDWDDEQKYFWLVTGYLVEGVLDTATHLLENGLNFFWTVKMRLNALSNMQISR